MPAEAIARLEAALGEAAGAEVALERPGDDAHGDYATNVAMRLAGIRRQPPRAIAEELAERAAALPDVTRAEIAGPGFVNLWLAPAWYGDALAEILAAGDRYGAGSAPKREHVQVELVSANPTGPITVAHARNGAYGDSVARLLEFAGHEVEREYYYNDAGAPDGALPPLGGRGPARGGAARGRLPRRLHRRAGSRPRRPGAADARADRGDAATGSGSTSTSGRSRAPSPPACRSCCRDWTRTRRTAPSGRAPPPTATTTTAC